MTDEQPPNGAGDPFAPPPDGAQPSPFAPPPEGMSAANPPSEPEPTTAIDVTPVAASRPPVDATQVIPTVATVPGAAAATGGVPPAGPHTTAPPMTPDPVPPPPGRSPAVIAGVAFAVIALIALLLVFFLTRGDDDGAGIDGADDGVRLVITRADESGVPVLTDVTASVSVNGAGIDPFQWVVPSDVGRAPTATRQTDATGRTEFRWAPLAGDDQGTWTSTVEFFEAWPDPTLGVLTVQCTLEGPTDEPLPIAVESGIEPGGFSAEPVVDAFVTRFPNIRLRVGDVVTCQVSGPVPPPFDPNAPIESTTTVPESTTTTSVESTTTVPESTTTTSTTTTVPETTTTTTTSTTTTTTTTPTTTTTTTTVPALPPITDVLGDEADLGDFLTLLDIGGLLDDLESPIRPVTVFAPTDEAMAQFVIDRPDLDLTDPSIARAVALAHISFGEALDAATLATRTSVLTEAGVDQPIDSADPLTIAGAEVERNDLAGLDAFAQVIDAVLPIGI